MLRKLRSVVLVVLALVHLAGLCSPFSAQRHTRATDHALAHAQAQGHHHHDDGELHLEPLEAGNSAEELSHSHGADALQLPAIAPPLQAHAHTRPGLHRAAWHPPAPAWVWQKGPFKPPKPLISTI